MPPMTAPAINPPASPGPNPPRLCGRNDHDQFPFFDFAVLASERRLQRLPDFCLGYVSM
jgi:hypothetical protein